jgi:hypothetical protein
LSAIYLTCFTKQMVKVFILSFITMITNLKQDKLIKDIRNQIGEINVAFNNRAIQMYSYFQN